MDSCYGTAIPFSNEKVFRNIQWAQNTSPGVWRPVDRLLYETLNRHLTG